MKTKTLVNLLSVNINKLFYLIKNLKMDVIKVCESWNSHRFQELISFETIHEISVYILELDYDFLLRNKFFPEKTKKRKDDN